MRNRDTPPSSSFPEPASSPRTMDYRRPSSIRNWDSAPLLLSSSRRLVIAPPSVHEAVTRRWTTKTKRLGSAHPYGNAVTNSTGLDTSPPAMNSPETNRDRRKLLLRFPPVDRDTSRPKKDGCVEGFNLPRPFTECTDCRPFISARECSFSSGKRRFHASSVPSSARVVLFRSCLTIALCLLLALGDEKSKDSFRSASSEKQQSSEYRDSFFPVHLPLVSAQRTSCEGAKYPVNAFASQPDKNLVYMKIDRVADPGFVRSGMVKFASVFGVRVVAVETVPDSKLLYVNRILAKMLDNDENGKPDNPTLVDTLNRRAATLGFAGSEEEMERMFDLLPPEYACVLFLVLEVEDSVLPGGNSERDCPNEGFADGGNFGGGEEEKDVDRTTGIVGDFIIQSGYPTLYLRDSEIGRLIESAFHRSKRNRWFIPNASRERCNLDCQKVSFQSWALSSALGVDTCSCRKYGVWKLCTPDEMRRGHPELYSAIMEGMEVPTGSYHSRATVLL